MPILGVKDSANPSRALIIDRKKFLWDGRSFESYDAASREAEAYKNDNFEFQLVKEGKTYLVYTRRVVKEVVVAAP